MTRFLFFLNRPSRFATATFALVLGSVVCMSCSAFAQDKSLLSSQQDDKEKPRASEQKAPYKVANRVVKEPIQKKTDDKQIDKAVAQKQNKSKTAPKTISHDEIREFLQSNHKELIPLLKTLEKSYKGQYASMMRTLEREIRNLRSLKERAPDRYESALDMWVTSSKIRHITARLALEKRATRKTALLKTGKNLLKKQYELRNNQLQNEIKALQARLKQKQGELSKRKANRETNLAKDFERMEKNAQRLSQNRKKNNKTVPVKSNTGSSKQKNDAGADKNKPKTEKKSN